MVMGMNDQETLKGRAGAEIRRQVHREQDVHKTLKRSPGSWPELSKRRKPTVIASLILASLLVMLVCGSLGSAFGNGPNLVLNPGIEEGDSTPTSWALVGTGYWSSDGHTGIHSIGVNAAGSDGWTISDKFLINEISKYVFSFWVKGTYTSGDFLVQLRFFNAGGSWLGQITYRVASSYSSWQCVNDTVTPLAGAAKGDIMFYGFGTPNGNIIVDDFTLTEITTVPSEASTWFDEMLFGTGFWLFIIIILAIVFSVVWVVPYSGAIFLPVCVFLAIEYFSKIETSSIHMWGAIMMLFASVYIIIVMTMKIRSK
jgi:hypothetical protein